MDNSTIPVEWLFLLKLTPLELDALLYGEETYYCFEFIRKIAVGYIATVYMYSVHNSDNLNLMQMKIQ